MSTSQADAKQRPRRTADESVVFLRHPCNSSQRDRIDITTHEDIDLNVSRPWETRRPTNPPHFAFAGQAMDQISTRLLRQLSPYSRATSHLRQVRSRPGLGFYSSIVPAYHGTPRKQRSFRRPKADSRVYTHKNCQQIHTIGYIDIQ